MVLPGETRRAVRRSLAELSERPLRGRLPVLRCLPLCALPYRSIARVRNPITATLSTSTIKLTSRAARAREGFCRFPAFFIHRRSYRGFHEKALFVKADVAATQIGRVG